MIQTQITLGLMMNIAFLLVALVVFNKVLSAEIYLSYHRLLPVISGVIVVYDLIFCAEELVVEENLKILLHAQASIMGLMALYLMFFYLLNLTRPKYYKKIIGIFVVMVLFMTAWNFTAYLHGKYSYFVDHLSAFAILVGSIGAIAHRSTKDRYFDKSDRRVAEIMMFSFLLTLTAYICQTSSLLSAKWYLGLAFTIDGLLYYEMARNNDIEDTASILKGTIYDHLDYPVFLFDDKFYMLGGNEIGFKEFPFARGVESTFEDNDFKKKNLTLEKMVSQDMTSWESYVGEKCFSFYINPVEMKGEMKGYIVTVTDVTTHHNMTLAAKAETAEKSMFLAQMSHELRSPIHAIMGISDILLNRKEISSKNRGLIQHIKRASDGLLDLVDAILDFSKLEAGKFEFAEKSYNIDELFEDLAYNNIINLQSKPVDFVIAVVSDFPKQLYGDVTRVREIFQNILGNAVKFTEKGYIRAEISFKDQGNDIVRIDFSVKDTGMGMTPEQLKEIFSEYVTTTDGTVMEGTGLGLCITNQLIKLLDGEIHATSDGVSGSTLFGHFYQKVSSKEKLPERAYNRRTVMQKSANVTSDIRPEWIYPKAQILVADDMKINQEILQQLLSPWRCRVDCVSDGLEAIRAAKDLNYQLIILDQMMVPMSGYETADKIREFSDAPIILATANTADDVRSQFRNHGINEMINKPIKVQQLQFILEQFMPSEYKVKERYDQINIMNKRDARALQAYQRTLETFIKEMEPLLLNLPLYMVDNHELFQIKVHGIKGVSNQIGRTTFAEYAEIMEMASKAGHWNYVEGHIDDFLDQMSEVIEDVATELHQMAPEVDASIASVMGTDDSTVLTKEEIRGIFEELKQAFDDFNIRGIEAGLEALSGTSLETEETKLYGRLKESCDELEYEEGSKLLEKYFQQ